MKTIKEQQTEYVLANTESVESYEAYAEKEEIAAAFEAGALSVCNTIDEAIANLKIGDIPMERFHKFDLLADIHDIIDQLKR